MIRPLRLRHRRMFAFLGVVLPVAVVMGVAARKPIPATPSLSTGLGAERRRFDAIQWSRADLFTKIPIRVDLVRERDRAGQFAIKFSGPNDFVRPDLLVYWIAGNADVMDTIPDSTYLLGGFNTTTPLPIPASAPLSNGKLILY